MALPKRKTPKAKQRQRRSHRAISAPQIVTCTTCRSPHINHITCPICGTYNGRQVLGEEEDSGAQ